MKRTVAIAAAAATLMVASLVAAGPAANAKDCQKGRGTTYWCGNSAYNLYQGSTGTWLQSPYGKYLKCREDFFSGRLVCG